MKLPLLEIIDHHLAALLGERTRDIQDDQSTRLKVEIMRLKSQFQSVGEFNEIEVTVSKCRRVATC